MPTGSASWNQLRRRKQISTAYWIMWKCLVKEMEIPLKIFEAFVSVEFGTLILGSCQASWLPFVEISFLFLSGFNFICSSSFSKDNLKNYQRDLDEVFFFWAKHQDLAAQPLRLNRLQNVRMASVELLIFFLCLATFGLLLSFSRLSNYSHT